MKKDKKIKTDSSNLMLLCEFANDILREQLVRYFRIGLRNSPEHPDIELLLGFVPSQFTGIQVNKLGIIKRKSLEETKEPYLFIRDMIENSLQDIIRNLAQTLERDQKALHKKANKRKSRN